MHEYSRFSERREKISGLEREERWKIYGLQRGSPNLVKGVNALLVGVRFEVSEDHLFDEEP